MPAIGCYFPLRNNLNGAWEMNMQDLDVPKQNQLPRTWLYELYRRRKARNEAYSLRAFARSIGLSPALTSQILSGKSSLTRKSAEVIADRLSLSPKQKRTLVLTAMGLAPSGGINSGARLSLALLFA
jgi:hypothetical protein